MIRNKKLFSCICAWVILLASLSIFPATSFAGDTGPLLAFPGADGVGKYTVGGRGGDIYVVTTLEDGPGIPGSLREACEAKGPRTVVFDVAGTIELTSNLRIRDPYITIAGQTAPGQGITLKNFTFSITADEVVVRNIRVRYGDMNDDDGMYIGNANNVIIDHCSVSWGVDETFSIKRSTNVTMQWCFVTEGLHESVHDSGWLHSKGSLLSGNDGQKISVHHNLYAHHDARSPRPQGLLKPDEDPIGFFCDITNNVMYDWGRAYAMKNLDQDEICTVNAINNYFIAGPSSNASNFMVDKNINTRLYFEGNYMNGKLPADQYKLITYEDFKKPALTFGDIPWKLTEPFDNGMGNIDSAEQAFARVLKNGGASLNRDAVDERIVGEVLSGCGRVIDKPSDGGGYPVLSDDPVFINAAKADFEELYGFEPYDEEFCNEIDPESGYTYLELFLNGLMEDLYEGDLEIPGFNNSLQWFKNICYRLFRVYREILMFFRSIPEFFQGLGN